MRAARIRVENIRYFGKFVIICCCLLNHVGTSDLSVHHSIAEYYKVHGVIKWIADSTAFCQLTTPVEPSAISFQEAYVTVENIVLELANCISVMMEVLHCVYKPVVGNLRTLLETVSVNGLNYDIFSIHVPGSQSKCNAPNAWVILEEIILGRTLVPTYQRLIQVPVVSVIDSAEKALAEYYRVNGRVKWKWDPRPFCESQISAGESSVVSLQGAYLAVDNVMLERANCTEIQMEILYCDYAHHGYTGQMRNFVNGLDEEVFDIRTPDWRSKCNAPSIWIIHGEIFEGVRLPLVLAN